MAHYIEFISDEEVKSFLKKKVDPIIITDDNVLKNYGFIKKFKYISIKPGEDNKTLSTINDIYNKLIEFGCNRHSYIVGIGGGIVTDITGYVASTFMRGVPFAFIPTTLLAMVDAAIGGKNGVNYDNYKNMIGTFNTPQYIGICLKFLETLDDYELQSGYGEILKYAIGFDKKLFKLLEKIPPKEIYRSEYINKIIPRCIKIKQKIVKKDPLEGNLRKTLNLGHTIGHAIEKFTHEYKHGQAVALGLYFINEFTNNVGKIYKHDEYDRIKNLIIKFFPWILNEKIDIRNFIDNIDKDKKSNIGNLIDIVLPENIGNCYITSIDKDILKKHMLMI